LEKLQLELRAELGIADPGVILAIEPAPSAPAQVIEPETARQLLRFLRGCPHGTLAMTPEIPGLVQTSTNLGIVETKGDQLTVVMSHRSSLESAKRDVAGTVADHCALAGLQVEHSHGYPGWAPNLASPLLALAKKVHLELFGVEPRVKAVHAGLECGIIGEKFPGMDTVSIGPTIQGAHSPDERVQIASVQVFWNYLCAMLAQA
jgi:dipeptidase D